MSDIKEDPRRMKAAAEIEHELSEHRPRPIEEGVERLERAIMRLDEQVNDRLRPRIEVVLGPDSGEVAGVGADASPACSPLLRHIWHLAEIVARITNDVSAMTDRVEL